MFGQIKNKIAQWCRSQVKVLSTDRIEQQGRGEYSNDGLDLVMMLPRNSYFEAYKIYPLSVGRDINKVAAIEGRQISPYIEPSWSGTLVLKQPEHYLVYYFVLLPKYQQQIEESLPLFVIPETAHSLLSLTKGKQISDTSISFHKDEKDVWLSSVPAKEDEIRQGINFTFERLTFPAIKAFFNPKVLHQLKGKFNRWQQVKLLSITAVIASLYIGITTLYLSSMDQYLTDKGDEARPIISELFKVKDKLSLLQQQQQEFAEIYQSTTEKSGALRMIEEQHVDFFLHVQSIEIVGDTVRLQGSATSANGVLEQLLKSPKISKAEFKSDIKSSGSREEFEIEFVWAEPLWEQKSNTNEEAG